MKKAIGISGAIFSGLTWAGVLFVCLLFSYMEFSGNGFFGSIEPDPIAGCLYILAGIISSYPLVGFIAFLFEKKVLALVLLGLSIPGALACVGTYFSGLNLSRSSYVTLSNAGGLLIALAFLGLVIAAIVYAAKEF